jgi:uncharacterized membrane protein YtjA (UPF0391 family)
MLRWALTFLVIAFIAAIFGFTSIAGSAAWIAKVIFLMFLMLFVFGLAGHLVRRRRA